MCRVPPLNTGAPVRIRTMVESSFAVRGPKLFNSLSIELRNFNGSVDGFKTRLDKFLSLIPDKPCTPGYHQPALSNSVIDQTALLRAGGIFT